MKRPPIISILCALTFLLTETAGAASNTADFEFDVEEGTRVHVRNFAGDINLVPGTSDKVRVRYTTEDDRINVYTLQGINFIRVRTDSESAQLTGNVPVHFEIEVPPASHVIVNNTAGNVNSVGEIERVELTTVSGAIELVDAAGEFALKTVSGNISINNISKAELTAETISGNINIVSSDFSGESYEMKTISGDISFLQGESASYILEAVTTTGSIENRLGNVEHQDFSGEFRPSPNEFLRYANSLVSEQTVVFGGYNGNFQSSRVHMQTVSGKILLAKD